MPSKTVLGESETSQRLPRNKCKADAGVQTLKVQGAGKMGEDMKGSHSGRGAGVRPRRMLGLGSCWERAPVCLLCSVGGTPPARSPGRNPGVRSSQHLPHPRPEGPLTGSLPLSRLTPDGCPSPAPPPHICSLRGHQGQTPAPSPDGGVPLLRSLQQPAPSMAGPAAPSLASSTHPHASSSTTLYEPLFPPPDWSPHHWLLTWPHAHFSRLSPNASSSLHPQTRTILGTWPQWPQVRDTLLSQHWALAGQASWQDLRSTARELPEGRSGFL